MTSFTMPRASYTQPSKMVKHSISGQNSGFLPEVLDYLKKFWYYRNKKYYTNMWKGAA
jgi:hypothetical protein